MTPRNRHRYRRGLENAHRQMLWKRGDRLRAVPRFQQ